MFKKFIKNKYNRGMTLVELIVVLAIFMIILGITIFDYSGFKSSVSIQNLADDIALSIRKSQSFAIGSRSLLNGGSVSNGYGVHFMTTANQGNPLLGSNKSFIIFSDMDDGKDYDNKSGVGYICGNSSPNTQNDCLEIITIKSIAKITDIKVDGSSIDSGSSVDVVFRRPNPDALFCYKKSSGSSCIDTISSITITVSSSNTDSSGTIKYKNIVIRNTGQISIE